MGTLLQQTSQGSKSPLRKHIWTPLTNLILADWLDQLVSNTKCGLRVRPWDFHGVNREQTLKITEKDNLRVYSAKVGWGLKEYKKSLQEKCSLQSPRQDIKD